MINSYLVPLAVPLLLFDSDLKRIFTGTGTLLAAFGVGTVATVIGTILAFPLIPLNSLGADTGWRIACALAARHIGGAINFVAVAETLSIDGSAVSAASKSKLWSDPPKPVLVSHFFCLQLPQTTLSSPCILPSFFRLQNLASPQALNEPTLQERPRKHRAIHQLQNSP